MNGKVTKTEAMSFNSTNLVHFGVEVRHLPLARHLPGAAKYISTRNWALARDELKFSRCFDRVAELREASEWGPSHLTSGQRLPIPQTNWDCLLEQVWFMARDFEQEGRWKREMAKILANEARKLYKLRGAGKDTTCFYTQSRQFLLDNFQKVYGPGSGLVLEPTVPPKHGFISASPLPEPSVPNVANLAIDDHQNRGPHVNWLPIEDSLLVYLLKIMPGNSLGSIAGILNLMCHNSHRIRTASDVYKRIPLLSNHDVRHNAKRHLDRMALMNSASTKLIAAKNTAPPKKLNMSAHPSHEAAARKANLNISKLLTPQELAMRRIQRARIMTDPSGAIMSVVPTHNTTAGQLPRAPGPPGSPNQRPVNTAVYQAAVAAASAATRVGAPAAQGSPAINHPATPMRPTAPVIPRPGIAVPSAAIAQQQRQALLNRSHQMTNYIATMQARPNGSPLLRPPSSQSSIVDGSPPRPGQASSSTSASPNKTPPKTIRAARKQ